ncbi:hypothetical protein FF2_042024 [Malus domestica]
MHLKLASPRLRGWAGLWSRDLISSAVDRRSSDGRWWSGGGVIGVTDGWSRGEPKAEMEAGRQDRSLVSIGPGLGLLGRKEKFRRSRTRDQSASLNLQDQP